MKQQQFETSDVSYVCNLRST